MFFYGTLKLGHPAHARLCRGALRLEEARVRGRLYDLPEGYPALQVPGEDVRRLGTTDYHHDAAEQRRLNEGKVGLSGDPQVHGELCCFDDPESRLPALDAYEGFDPAGPSLYRRVLVPALASGGPTLAWTYVMTGPPPGTPLPGGRWPP